MKIPAFLCLVVSILITGQLSAQNKIQVVDDATKFPIEGMNVIVGNKAILTDKAGFFDVDKISPILPSDSITLSLIGYFPKKVISSDLTDFIIYMTQNPVHIGEITVMGKQTLNESISFEKLTSLKYGAFAFGYTLVGDSICIIGGDISIERNSDNHYYEYEHNMGKMQLYDIKSDSWSVSDKKFLNRAYHNIHYYDGKIYVLGGKRLAKNPQLEYLNEVVEVYDIKRDTVYSSSSNPHQAVNFTSCLFDNNIIVMNGSIRQNRNAKEYTNQAHLFNLQTGFWYEVKKIPYSYESTGIVADGILYQIGGYKGKALSYINSYDRPIPIGDHQTYNIFPILLERPALAYNDEEKKIYIYEHDKLLTYNILTKEICVYKVDLDLMYSGMIYKDNYLYIVGGKTAGELVPSNGLYRIDIKELKKTKWKTIDEV